jgi:hypothetical protein
MLTFIEKGPLDVWIVDKLSEMWLGIEEAAPVNSYKVFLQLQKK